MTDGELIDLAQATAREAHAGQFRRDGVTPYAVHPEAVASRVGDDPQAVAVAWLHDVIEDTPVTAEQLEQRGFPPQVVQAVQVLTKREGLGYADYLEAVAASPLACRVKVADMLSNLADGPTDRQIVKYAKGLLRLVGDADGAATRG